MFRVLVVDDDQGLRTSVRAALSGTGQYEVEEASDGLQAVARIKKGGIDLAILDVDMPNLSGLEALKLVKDFDPSIVVLILTAFSNVEDAVKAVKDGAYNYVAKPVKHQEILEMVQKAIEAHSLVTKIAASSPILHEDGKRIIGGSNEMVKVFNIIHKLSKVETPVLIRGESGTGKELVARAIHFNSSRKDDKFVAINCSAIPETLFESELFGHEKGSFTGAHERKIGKFQFAEGGTLFLDEVGDLSMAMQAKLLRVLQEKKFIPVGSNREIFANVRIIAATNRNLDEMIKTGQYREDLFYRLNVIPIFLPALRERKNDLDSLINGFISKFNKAHKKEILGLAPEALACLKKYQWPGNIRELENVIEHAFIIEGSNKLTLSSLPDKVTEASGFAQTTGAEGSSGPDTDVSTGSVIITDDRLDFNRHKEMFEREFIMKALKTFKGKINQTALHANIPKKTLLRKIEKYGIVAKDFAEPKN